MHTHNPYPNQNSRYNQRPNACQEHNDNRHQNQYPQNLPVRHRAAEDYQGLIWRPEGVETEPGGDEGEEGEEGEWVWKEGESEYDCEDGQVIYFEVGEVFAYSRGGLGEGEGAGESGAVDEFEPGTAVGEGSAEGREEAREEGAEGGEGWGCGGGGGGFGGRDRESLGGHFGDFQRSWG